METNELIAGKYNNLKEFCKQNWNEESLTKLDNALKFVSGIHGTRNFPTGENIICHSLDVAMIIASELGLDNDSVITGVLHNLMYPANKNELMAREIEDLYGQRVLKNLEAMAKINSLGTDTVDIHPENYRKLMLALAGDIRVILIKIADRLQVMRNIAIYDAETQKRLLIESTYLYAPLAHRLGLYYINSEMLDINLKYEKPENFAYIVNRLKETEKERANFVAEFVKPVEEKLKKRGMAFHMKARTKSIHSIWNKMQNKKVSFDEVIDLFAIRIILESLPENEKADCWTAYSIVTEEYQTSAERLRDWITIPKSNGYESLHTTVLGPQGKWVEIQIRTRRMDEIAEKGVAAHWKYKGGKEKSGFDNWLAGIRDILENPDLNINDFIDQFKTDIYSDEIFVFTPKGDLRKLAKNSTLLDFAYEIHSELGNKCVGGIVNGKKVTLKHILNNGDQVSIDTSSNQKPKLDWLDFLVTSKAKNKVKSSLNEERNNLASQGKEMIARKFKNWKIELNDEVVRKILKKYGFKLANDFYYDIAVNKIEPLEIKALVSEKPEEETTRLKIEDLLSKAEAKELQYENNDDILVIDNNIKNLNYRLAPCCNPVFGDSVFGFVTINEGIKIHRENCPNSPQMHERYPYRIIKARWQNSSFRSSFPTTLHISGTGDPDMLSNITSIISKDGGTHIRSVNIDSDSEKFDGIFKIMVYDLEHLDFLIQKLVKIKGVLSVTRGEI